jgi:hypothetical protein
MRNGPVPRAANTISCGFECPQCRCPPRIQRQRDRQRREDHAKAQECFRPAGVCLHLVGSTRRAQEQIAIAPTSAPAPCAKTAPIKAPTINPNAHMMVLPAVLGSLSPEGLSDHPTDGLAAGWPHHLMPRYSNLRSIANLRAVRGRSFAELPASPAPARMAFPPPMRCAKTFLSIVASPCLDATC